MRRHIDIGVTKDLCIKWGSSRLTISGFRYSKKKTQEFYLGISDRKELTYITWPEYLELCGSYGYMDWPTLYTGRYVHRRQPILFIPNMCVKVHKAHTPYFPC